MDKVNVKIREASLDDFKNIQQLNQLLFHSDFEFDKTLKLDWPKSQEGIAYFKNRINSKKSCVFVAYFENQIVGYLIGTDLGIQKDRNMGKLGELENMFILEKYRIKDC